MARRDSADIAIDGQAVVPTEDPERISFRNNWYLTWGPSKVSNQPLTEARTSDVILAGKIGIYRYGYEAQLA